MKNVERREKEAALRRYCFNTSCKECVLNCITIGAATEKELDRELELIEGVKNESD